MELATQLTLWAQYGGQKHSHVNLIRIHKIKKKKRMMIENNNKETHEYHVHISNAQKKWFWFTTFSNGHYFFCLFVFTAFCHRSQESVSSFTRPDWKTSRSWQVLQDSSWPHTLLVGWLFLLSDQIWSNDFSIMILTTVSCTVNVETTPWPLYVSKYGTLSVWWLMAY